MSARLVSIRTLPLALLLATAGMLPAAPAQAQLNVAEASLATAIEDREPRGVADSFPAEVEQVFLWTRVTGAVEETVVEHVWYFEDEETDRVSLAVGGPSWRTWSAKTIPADWTGEWRVEVLGPDDSVLESVSFTVR